MTKVMSQPSPNLHEPPMASIARGGCPIRSLLPREHGAYAQLGLPMFAALASGKTTPAAALLALSAVCAFFAHEPARVVWGHRGSRAQRVDGERARRRMMALGVLTVVLAAVGLLLAPATRVPVMIVLPLVVLAAGFALRDADRTLLGETIAGAALPAMAMPVAVASGVRPSEAIAAWCVWAFAFALSTSAVRTATARSAVERQRMPSLVFAIAAVGAIAFVEGFAMVATALPVVVVALIVVAARPAARQVRRVGWAFAAVVTMTAAALVAHARMG